MANVVIGLVQEYSAQRTLDRITLLHQDDAIVLRHGERVPVRVADIVQDDVVVLRRGDQVPVDGEVLTAEGLDREEALLTGENDPVPTHPGDAVLPGSAVVAGRDGRDERHRPSPGRAPQPLTRRAPMTRVIPGQRASAPPGPSKRVDAVPTHEGDHPCASSPWASAPHSATCSAPPRAARTSRR
ncbi:P-type ATPase [Micrococcus aloeverae]